MDIHDACENGNVHFVIQLLLSNAATLTDRDEIGNTPLHNACLGAQVKLVALFLGQSIDYQHLSDEDDISVAVQIVGSGTEHNQTFLDTQEVRNYSLPKDLCIDRQELSCGSPLYRDNYGSTPLTTLCALGSDTNTDAMIAKLLILAGDPVNAAKTTDHMSPLSWAAYHGDLELLTVLLDPCTGPRANPIWESLPNQCFPIDLAGLRAAVNEYDVGEEEEEEGEEAVEEEEEDIVRQRSDVLHSSPQSVPTTNGGATTRSSSSPKECCMYLVEYGVACLGDELKFAHAAGLNLAPHCLCRYRTHLLYWAATCDMVDAVRTIMEHREQELNTLYSRSLAPAVGTDTSDYPFQDHLLKDKHAWEKYTVTFGGGSLGMKLNIHPEASGCFGK